MFTLDVLTLTPLSTSKQAEPELTAGTGDRPDVGQSVPAVHLPLVNAVVVDGVRQRHLLVEEQTILTALQAHRPIFTLVELLAGGGVGVDLDPVKHRAAVPPLQPSAQSPHLLHQLLPLPVQLLAGAGAGEAQQDESDEEGGHGLVLRCSNTEQQLTTNNYLLPTPPSLPSSLPPSLPLSSTQHKVR